MLIENCFNNKLIFGIFNSSKIMKTSQIKKLMTLQTKPIKLKFENIKNQQPILKFSTEDIPSITYLYTTIEDTLKNGQTIQQDTLRLIYSIIKRVKKMVEEMDAENNKIRFRVVKSAKKSNIEVTNAKIIQPNCQHNKSTITFPILSLSENRAQSTQLAQNKQNSNYISNISNNSINFKENKSSTFSSSYSRQVKLKKFDSKPSQIAQLTQIKAITQQQVNLKLRAEARKLLEEVENKKKINGALNEKIKQLQEQIIILNKRVGNQEAFKIDFKFSLKCIEGNGLDKLKDQPSSIGLVDFQQKNQQKERYIEQYLNQLRLMIVTQNKQIETLHKRISDRESELTKKSSRWTSY